MLLALWFACVLGSGDEAPVTVEVHPAAAALEATEQDQLLSVDFVLTSQSSEELTVGAIELSVLDRAGKLQLRSTVNSDGERPSIDVLGAHRLRPGEPELIMNPFQRLDGALDASELRFDFKLYGKEQVSHATVTLHPRRTTPTAVRLPVEGRLWVFDGDDFYSHHRRFDFVSSTARQLGFRSNLLRHAVDLVLLDAAGATHHGDPDRNESWFGFGRPVLAAAPGTVVAAVDSRPDSRRLDLALLKSDQMAMFGNHAVVKLDSGEFALYAHLRQGSLRCKVGERVREGQQLGSIGASGGSAMPHLHFELQTSADANGEGQPVRFKGFRRILGSRVVAVRSGRVETGQILEAAPASR
ncbi:MAG TPA: M23 family metallopeptidase [Myxococcaceae bacterium]|nr:M23 family metallopeptidase [Myxococcaceae bacterium]